MKRFAQLTLTLVFVLGMLQTTTYASGMVTIERIDYADGSYALIVPQKNMNRSTTHDGKSYVYYNSSNVRCFSYTLEADFTYNGRISRADSCSASVTLYDRNWELNSHDEYTSGNTAYGEAVFSGPGGASRTVSLTLTCDKNGNVT